MKLEVLVVDDEKDTRSRLKRLISEHCKSIKCIGEANSVQEAKEFLNKTSVDAVFLDIKMQDGDGFKLIESIPNYSYLTVFVTAFNNYALKALKANAVDYLLKPVTTEDIIAVETKLLEKYALLNASSELSTYQQSFKHMVQQYYTNEKANKITISTVEGLKIIPVEDIIYLKASSYYTIINLADKTTIVASRVLKDFEDILDDAEFFRIHRSIIINLNYLKECVNKEVTYAVMNTGERLEISRRRKEQLFEKIKTFTFTLEKR
jgi:two-component system LytT family response regulator